MRSVSDNLLLGAAGARGAVGSRYIVVTSDASPYVRVYPWSNAAGFGTPYANPATLPAGSSYGAAWSPTSSVLLVTFSAVPRAYAYRWSSAGFGSVYSNPSTALLSILSETNKPSFSIPGTAVLFPSAVTSPYLRAYSWSDSTGFGSAYTAPATPLPTFGQALACSFHPSNQAFAVGHYTSPFVSAYVWSESTGFGTKYSNPAVLPYSTGRGVHFNKEGTAVAVGHSRTTGVFGMSVYSWTNASGFGVKYSDPASFTNIDHNTVRFSPNSDFIVACLGGSSLRVGAWNWNNSTGFGTYYNPSVRPDNTSQDITISADGLVVADCAFTTGNRVFAWPFTPGVGFGTLYSAPASPMGGINRSVEFSPT